MGVFSSVVASFWVGAIISILVLGWTRFERGQKRLQLSSETLTMKSAVPFAPFMIIGAGLVYFFNFNALSFFSFI
jgi:prepilin signal peptidase PulO-like enzyme (type II secretory pathway)